MALRSTTKPVTRRVTTPVTGSGGGGGESATLLLLDTYTATAAYSLRKLRNGYTGNCIRVRRSNDNTEQDIGFVDNELDTVSLLTFCGAGDGFVTTRYDQVGSKNQTQTTTSLQPQIVNSGAVIQTNSKPALDFGSAGDKTFVSDSVTIRSVFFVFRPTDTATSFRCFILGDSTTFAYHSGISGNWIHPTFSDVKVRGGSNRINGSAVTITSTLRVANQLLMSMVHTDTVVSDQCSKDRASTTNSWQGTRQEEIMFDTDQAANVAAIESNINTYWGVF